MTTNTPKLDKEHINVSHLLSDGHQHRGQDPGRLGARPTDAAVTASAPEAAPPARLLQQVGGLGPVDETAKLLALLVSGRRSYNQGFHYCE